ncbi:hypothetical protein M2145_000645 [Lachnospiraceae bacterium PF1-21]|uniref:GrdX family protein n=1 Tax=Ohessyouella blattaphilus TaxID=2949333 RepID=UPI003E2AE2AA
MLRKRENILIITNNERVAERFAAGFQVELLAEYGEVLLRTRDALQTEYRLLTHPMSGSLKPNQTPFKTIILERVEKRGALDMNSIELIERAMAAYHKFYECREIPAWSERSREDFRTVDLSLMEPAIERL